MCVCVCVCLCGVLVDGVGRWGGEGGGKGGGRKQPDIADREIISKRDTDSNAVKSYTVCHRPG